MVSYEDIPRQILGTGGRSRRPAPYGMVTVSGPDAKGFLQGLCSQDIAGMADGAVRPAAFLNAKGRLLSLCHAGVLGETVYLSTQDHLAADLGELLERFHFSERLEVAVPEWSCDELVGLPRPGARTTEMLTGGGIVLAIERGGVFRLRYHAPAGSIPKDALPTQGEELGADAAECLRIFSGELLVGRDTETNTLALELPIDDHISTTKGCYTGQEIVARIHTYGHTNRGLRRLGIAGTGPIEPGTALVETDEGEPVGRVMTSADVPGEDARIAFGFLPRVLCEPGTELELGAAGGPAVRVL